MAITAIKHVQNRSDFSFQLRNFETPTDSTGFISPGEDADVNVWIPWAPDAAAFPNHHLSVDFGPRPNNPPQSFVIWQAHIAGDGDYVRFADDLAWHDPGLKMPGLAEVGGDRWLIVFNDRIQLAEPGRHGITSIVRVDNGASRPVTLFAKDGSKPDQTFTIEAGESADIDLWVPWATSSDDFATHFVDVMFNNVIRWRLWQADRADGDFVRVTTDAAWSDPGTPIDGTAQVGGDRALVVMDDSIEMMSAQRRPAAPPGEGNTELTLGATSTQFLFQDTPINHPGVSVVSVGNIARDVNDKVAIPLLVSLDTASGNVGQHRIEPNDTSNDFAGFPIDGQWSARATDISQTLLRDFVTLLVHWKAPPPVAPDIVQCVLRANGRNPSSPIASIGGTNSDGTPWRLEEGPAIEQIKNGRTLYVIGVTGKRTRVVVGRNATTVFLRTLADNDKTNNLSSLPNCT
jgi:Protein of unknown function (DUF3892)